MILLAFGFASEERELCVIASGFKQLDSAIGEGQVLGEASRPGLGPSKSAEAPHHERGPGLLELALTRPGSRGDS